MRDQTQFDRSRVASVGDINEALGLLLSTAKLSQLGFEPVAQLGAARYYSRESVPAIARALADDLTDRVRGWH